MTDDPQRIGSSDDAESEIDLSPREVAIGSPRKRRPWGAIIVLLLVVVAGFVVKIGRAHV